MAAEGKTEGKGPVMWLLVSCRRGLMRSGAKAVEMEVVGKE